MLQIKGKEVVKKIGNDWKIVVKVSPDNFVNNSLISNESIMNAFKENYYKYVGANTKLETSVFNFYDSELGFITYQGNFTWYGYEFSNIVLIVYSNVDYILPKSLCEQLDKLVILNQGKGNNLIVDSIKNSLDYNGCEISSNHFGINFKGKA